MSAPIAGDPAAVRSMATHYRSIATDIASAASTLTGMRSGNTSSDAVDAFVEKAGDLAAKLRKAHGRYQGTGDALADYASALEVAIDTASRASASHATATGELDSADRLSTHYSDLASSTANPDDVEHFQQQASAQQQRAATLRAEASRAAAAIEQAERDRDRAAETAIARIDDSTDDGLHDNAWNTFQHWMKENDAWLSKVSEYLGYIGAGLALVALFFPPFAILAAIGVAAMAVGAAIDTARAAAGTGSWTDAALSVIGCFTFGAGAAASKAVAVEGKALVAARGVRAGQGMARPRSWVRAAERTYERSAPKVGDKALRNAWGDGDVAQASNYLHRTVPGQVPGDAVRLNEAVSKARRWAGANFGYGMATTLANTFGATDALDVRWSPKLGTAW